MARLDDIPKKEFFTTPPDYFENLPAAIQSRTQKRPEQWSFPIVKYSLQYALPLMLIIAALFFYRRSIPDAESILASVDTEALIAYLQDAGLSTDDVLETIEFSAEELQAIEDEIYRDSFFELDSAIIEL